MIHLQRTPKIFSTSTAAMKLSKEWFFSISNKSEKDPQQKLSNISKLLAQGRSLFNYIIRNTKTNSRIVTKLPTNFISATIEIHDEEKIKIFNCTLDRSRSGPFLPDFIWLFLLPDFQSLTIVSQPFFSRADAKLFKFHTLGQTFCIAIEWRIFNKIQPWIWFLLWKQKKAKTRARKKDWKWNGIVLQNSTFQ